MKLDIKKKTRVAPVSSVHGFVGGQIKGLLSVIGSLVQREMQSGMSSSGPSRPGQPPAVNTGNLRSNIVWELDSLGMSVAIGVTARAAYGLFLELGTGIFGPRNRVITPVSKQVLHWISRGQEVFAMTVLGVRPRPFMVPALQRVMRNFEGMTLRV